MLMDAVEQGVNPCQQFFCMKGLAQIVVSPGFKAIHFFIPRITRGQD
jgi:hypothetical protein